jgi:peptidyl-prolyl cis-trans isomerase D
MALINEIRKRSGLAVGIVAIGLGLFIVGTDIIGPNSAIMGNNKTDVGEIAGEEIDITEYQNEIEQLKYNYTLNYQRTPTESEMYSIRQQAWDYLIVKTAFQKQYEELGLTVTEDEQWDMVQGKNVNWEIRQAFTNPETGEFQREMVINYLKQINQMPPAQQASWHLFEQNLTPARLRMKFDNLLVKGTYVTEAEARRQYNFDNSVAEIKYLYLPYYSINDSAINITDEDLKAYLNDHVDEYEVEENRDFSYVSFPIVPSAEDSAEFREELTRLSGDFKNTTEDSIFARSGTDGEEYFATYSVAELPSMLQRNYSNLSEGDVRGPYFDNGTFNLYKVSGITEDTTYAARASHILIKWADESDDAKAKARREAENILRQARGGADFAELAREHSVDGSAAQGGDLGWFGPGQMVEPFETAVFNASGTGVINKVIESQFGYHIIKVTEAKTNQAFQIAHISREIIPSDITRNEAFRQADYFASSTGNYDEFIANAKNDSITVYEAEDIDKNDRRFNDLSNARTVVQWAYADASVGDVSSVKELDDRYIVAVLTGITEAGKPSLADVREQLVPKVKGEKKAKIILDRIASWSGSLEEMATQYGSDAKVYSSSDLKLSANSLPNVGFAPEAIGAAFALNDGERSEPVKTENGVVIIEMLAKTQAPEIADYTTYKNQLEQQYSSRTSYSISEAIKDWADIEDRRYRYF